MRAHAGRAFLSALLGLVATTSIATAAGPLQFYSITPCRIVNTLGPTGQNGGPALANGQTRDFLVRGLCGIPSGGTPLPKAVVLNATIVLPSAAGWVVLWQYNPPPNSLPPVSIINFNPGETIANGAVVALHPTDTLAQISAYVSGANTHLIIDVVGYYQ